MKFRRGQDFSRLISLFSLVVLSWGMILSFTSISFAQEAKKDLPPRGIAVAPEYTGIVLTEGEDVSLDLTVINKGRRDEDIRISLPTVPEGWDAWVKTYNYGVTGTFVKSDSSKSLTLRLEPREGTGQGEYTFAVKAETADGKLAAKNNVYVRVIEKKAQEKSQGVNITTSYPVLQGPTDAEFEFSLEVENKTDKDTIFNVNAAGPMDWEINLKPAYEEKIISSLRIKAERSETMAVKVKPPVSAEPGEYPIKVKVGSDRSQAEAELKVILTGTYKMEVGTVDGLLSLNALQGKPANFSFYVKNTGSAALNNLRFLSFKPENWKAEFKPESIESLGPSEVEQVEFTVTPADQALVGDYSVSLATEGGKTSKNMELRVTVKAATAWGWIGIGIIVIVLAGLVTLFFKLGRR